jgi:hypothetical protein
MSGLADDVEVDDTAIGFHAQQAVRRLSRSHLCSPKWNCRAHTIWSSLSSRSRHRRPKSPTSLQASNGEKIGDRLASAAAQQLRLAWVAGLGDEPLAQALPALAPCRHAGAIGDLTRIALARGFVFTLAVAAAPPVREAPPHPAARGGVFGVAASHDAEQTRHLPILKIR